MKKVNQTILHDPDNGVYGNCMSAAIASILNLELDDVPYFAENYNSNIKFWDMVIDFLRSQSYAMLNINPPYPANMDDVWCLIHGDSPRFPGTGHTVVGFGGDVFFDPHPSRDGVGEIDMYTFLIPLEIHCG